MDFNHEETTPEGFTVPTALAAFLSTTLTGQVRVKLDNGEEIACGEVELTIPT